MPGALTIPLWLALAGALLLAAGLAIGRLSGARAGIARRLAGARQMRVGELLAIRPPGRLPGRPVRVTGRVRCADPIVTAEADRLVVFHRDVEVRLPSGAWLGVERLRESRSFELWDHDGSLAVDPAQAAEPVVVLPHVWAGAPAELDESYAPALARLATEHGELLEARATTRMLSVIDRPLVLADVRRDPGNAILLAPPAGGYVISGLELDDAMRLLGGSRPRLLLAGAAAVAVATVLLVGAILLGVAALVGS